MAVEQNSSRESLDILDLPFIKDVPHPIHLRRTKRDFWAVPVKVDYEQAYETGERWAADWLKYAEAMAPLSIWAVVREMIRKGAEIPADDNRWGLACGFVNTIEKFAIVGAKACGGAHEYVERNIAYYQGLEDQRLAEKKKRDLTCSLPAIPVRRLEIRHFVENDGHEEKPIHG